MRCPWCDICIVIEAVNCGRFVCGVLRETGHQVNPHAPKQHCEQLVRDGLIWGCGKPFKFVGGVLKKCEYDSL